MSNAPWIIRRAHHLTDRELNGLADLLVDCVDGGASVSFMKPLSKPQAHDFWQRIAAEITRGARAILLAEDSLGICGTVQLVLEMPENQPHRADLCKVLVHSRVRRQGLGAALMRSADSLAIDCHKTLLVLDTVAGSDAERLYQALGWIRVGSIPGYAISPIGEMCSTTLLYRELGSKNNAHANA